MTMPFSANETYSAGNTPSIKAQTLNDLQNYLASIYSGNRTLQKNRWDGTGNNAVAPNALLELAAAAGVTVPELVTMDASGRARFIFDHNGFPTAYGFSELWEQWNILPGTSGSPLASNLAAGAALGIQSPSSSYAARYLQVTPSTSGTLSSASAVYGPTGGLLYLGANQDVVMEGDVGLNTAFAAAGSAVDFFFGLDSGTDPINTAADATFGIVKLHGVNTYALFYCDGTHINAQTGSIAATAGTVPTDRLRLEFHGASTAIGAAAGAAVIKAYVNGALLASVTAGAGVSPWLPASQVKPVIGTFNSSAPVGGPLAYLGPWVVCWNRFLNPTAM